MTRLIVLLLLIVGAWFQAAPGQGHEVPNQTTVLAFLKPEGNTLRLLVRLPMKAFQDAEVPTLPNGLLDLSRSDTAIRNGMQVWIGDLLGVYENGVRLSKPQIVATNA